jgi:hypothetical protein
MDIVLACNLLRTAFILPAIIGSLILTIITIAAVVNISSGNYNVFKSGLKTSLRFIFVGYVGILLFCCIVTFSNIPNIMIRSNIDRIKLRYTDTETIKKLERGAENIVEKLDKLIDAGIKKVEQGGE